MNKKDHKMGKRNAFIDWCKDIAGLISENKKLTGVVLCFVLLVAAAIGISTVAGRHNRSKEAALMAETEGTEQMTIEVPTDPMEENAYPEINTLVKKYYQIMADGNVEELSKIVSHMEDKEKIKIQKKSEYIESYQNIAVYTKKGPLADSFVVYAYYEVQLTGYESLAPGVNTLYICKNDEGQYYIDNGEQDERIIEYCKKISAQDDVIDLFNTVQVKYNELKTNDEELSVFLDELPDLLTAAVGEELAKLEADTAEPSVEEEPEPTIEEQEKPEEEKPVEVIKKAKTTAVVNIRSSDSETADKVGKAQMGEEFTLLEERGNGWSKIKFEDREAYIKSDYLEVISEEIAGDAQADAGNASVSGTATVKTNVNIRKSASEKAERLGVCYVGEKLDVIMKQADGWTKVQYNGKIGYVKSEFLE